MPEHKKKVQNINGVKEWRYKIEKTNGIKFLQRSYIGSRNLYGYLIKRGISFDIINFHQPFSSLGIVYPDKAKLIPKLYTCHSLSHEEFISRNPFPSSLIRKVSYKIEAWIRKTLERKIIKRCDKIIVLSNYTKKKLESIHTIPSFKIHVIPGGVDLNKFSPSSSPENIRERLKIPKNKIVLLTIRNLVYRMGLDRLIISMKYVISKNSKVLLLIGGEGPLYDKLNKLVLNLGLSKYIRFLGYIPDDILSDYYRASDLFILPSKELEGFGLVTVEAMACSLPVLGTAVGGTKEIIGGFDKSFLLFSNEPRFIAKGILEKCNIIVGNREQWNRIRKKCREYVEKNFSWDRNLNMFESLLKEIQKRKEFKSRI